MMLPQNRSRLRLVDSSQHAELVPLRVGQYNPSHLTRGEVGLAHLNPRRPQIEQTPHLDVPVEAASPLTERYERFPPIDAYAFTVPGPPRSAREA